MNDCGPTNAATGSGHNAKNGLAGEVFKLGCRAKSVVELVEKEDEPDTDHGAKNKRQDQRSVLALCLREDGRLCRCQDPGARFLQFFLLGAFLEPTKQVLVKNAACFCFALQLADRDLIARLLEREILKLSNVVFYLSFFRLA